MTRRNIQANTPYLLPVQADHPVADRRKHAFDLMKAAFGNGEQHLSGADGFQSGRQGGGGFALQQQALGKAGGHFFCQRVPQADPVRFFTLLLRPYDIERPAAVVGEQHQTRGVRIQPADDVQITGPIDIQPMKQRRIDTVHVRAQGAGRFVHHEVTGGASDQTLSGKGNAVVFMYLGRLIGYRCPVDEDLAGMDDPSGLGSAQLGTLADEFIEAHGRSRWQQRAPLSHRRHRKRCRFMAAAPGAVQTNDFSMARCGIPASINSSP
ncbi:hypothetical protein GCM10007082_15120 [Oceanisphaera arctica]|nr:hypothetical protein GCM10007082_15120 [Oceanisphaera arctica]